ncbi:YkgJ family cysteine cluster protein [Clostridium butanoliproducens]|uniref:YkgJ family cysteine cluster protein n=1 Tax=Clostridium butanoliproducens TaxID=2991837 RepID=UPI0024BA3956|nr:YkgJ family cysteine cluster protein [Clostridium butanoliproducens]MDU1348757.1 YkgJ family cysteine cluster protein [Clostridium argentinense]
MLDYKDITEELCIRCGECCKIYIPIKGNDRYINFIKTIGIPYIEDAPNVIRLIWGDCPKLKTAEENGIKKYYCTIYGTRPKMCRDFNCVAWANYTNTYQISDLINKAEKTFECLHEEKD